MKTGIVILNYNDSASTIEITEKILPYASLNHIAIVDNCSSDNSYEVLKEKYSYNEKVAVMKSDKNGGYSYGNNFGAKYLINNYNVDIIIIANPDVLFEEEVIKAFVTNFTKDKNYGVLSAVMTRPDGSVDPAPYRECYSYAHDLGDCFLTIRRLVYEKKTYPVDYSSEIQDVEVIQGSFFAITKEAFLKIGGLDENLFLYYEELVLAKRLQSANYKTGLITNQKYIHNHSVSIRKSLKNINIWKNVLKSKYYYQKQYNKCGVIKMFILHLFGYFSIFEKIMIEVLRKVLYNMR